MTVRVNKPSFNIREKLSELGRKFGLKGSELAAAETVQEARDLVSAGRKNLIINGGLQIWQRGSSITGSYSSRPYTADMFRIYNVISGSGATFSQSTDVPSKEFTYSLKRDTTSYNGHSEINIPIELNRTGFESPFIPGETYTFSYWVKGDGTDTSWINNATGRWSSSVSSGTYVSDRLVKGYSGSGKWEKVIHEFTIDSAVPGSATFFSILIGRNMSHVGVNYWTGFQLERGRNATDFEHRSYGEELKLCERYFEKIWQNNNTESPHSGGDGYNTISPGLHNGSHGYYVWKFRTQKRIRPTINYAGKFRVFGASSITNLVFNEFYQPGIDAARLRVGHSGSAGDAFILEFDGGNSSNGYISASAEL